MTLAPGEEEILKKSACLSAAIFLAWGDTAFADEFQNLKCGTDIPKAMIGKHSSNGPVVEFEKKYRALGLKGLGADEISDSLSSVSWLICGAEYVELIDRRGLVRDVVPFPPHSRSAPAFSGICQAKGRDLPDIILAVLDGSTSADPLPVKTAWKIDQKAARFVPVSERGLTCPRSGIYTVDGGS
jgi:hypothetical protein